MIVIEYRSSKQASSLSISDLIADGQVMQQLVKYDFMNNIWGQVYRLGFQLGDKI